jgi:hypothetical protein
VRPKPLHPSSANRRWQHKFIPKREKLVDVYKERDIFLGTFSKDLLIHTNPVRPVAEVIAHHGLAPTNVKWQFHDAGRLHDIFGIDVVGHCDGPSVWAEDFASGASHIRSLRTPSSSTPHSSGRITVPTLSQQVGLSPSHRVPMPARSQSGALMSSRIGLQRYVAGSTEILLNSLIMLRSLVRFQLAPPSELIGARHAGRSMRVHRSHPRPHKLLNAVRKICGTETHHGDGSKSTSRSSP